MATIDRDKPQPLILAGRGYLGVRFTEPEARLGHIEITDPESGKLIGRVSLDGKDGSMRITTFGHELPRATVEALWQLAEDALA